VGEAYGVPVDAVGAQPPEVLVHPLHGDARLGPRAAPSRNKFSGQDARPLADADQANPERLRVALGLKEGGLYGARSVEGARALGLDQQPVPPPDGIVGAPGGGGSGEACARPWATWRRTGWACVLVAQGLASSFALC
jgi:hypothetical protein